MSQIVGFFITLHNWDLITTVLSDRVNAILRSHSGNYYSFSVQSQDVTPCSVVCEAYQTTVIRNTFLRDIRSKRNLVT